jgi:hypothetical protein
MTFEFSLGVIRYPNDVKKEIIQMLQIVSDSDYEFYEKNIHIDVINTLVIKKQIIEKISNQTYELKFHPIVNTKNQLEGYLVTHGIDERTIRDKRIELLIIQYSLETIQKVKKKTRFFINVSNELVKSIEFLDVLKQFRNFDSFFNNVSFIFDEANTESEEYLIKKKSKISRRSVESLYKQQKKVDFLFQNIIYDGYSREYVRFLSELEDKGVRPIFEVASKNDLQFVIDSGIGFVYTKMAQDVLIVKS